LTSKLFESKRIITSGFFIAWTITRTIHLKFHSMNHQINRVFWKWPTNLYCSYDKESLVYQEPNVNPLPQIEAFKDEWDNFSYEQKLLTIMIPQELKTIVEAIKQLQIVWNQISLIFSDLIIDRKKMLGRKNSIIY